MRRALARLAAAVIVTAAAGVVAGAPAQAAGCSGGTGVTVVVDFRDLGGGVREACAPGGAGQEAGQLFVSAGFALTRVNNQPGFVCRVESVPANDPCQNTPPSTAYWGLWSSDGTSGHWDYASLGVDGLSAPDGGSVGLSWKQGSGAAAPPGVTPSVKPVAPTPTASAAKKAPAKAPAKAEPKPSPTRSTAKATPTKAASSAVPKPSAVASGSTAPAPVPSAAATKRPAKAAPAKPGTTPAAGSATPSAPATSAAASEAPLDPPSESVTPGANETTGAPAQTSDDGLPTWVAPLLVVLLFGAAGGVAVVRRRRSP